MQHHPEEMPFPLDPDLVLLESYLDGELTSAERQTLQVRLAHDAELSAALSRLSAEYTVRQAVWTSLEGTNDETDRTARRVVKGIRRASLWERSRNAIRVGAAVAACVVCFVAGWIGRGSNATAATAPSPATHPAAVIEPVVYRVALTDDQGNITAVQAFDNADDARAFAADVGRWQAQQAQVQGGQPVLTRLGL